MSITNDDWYQWAHHPVTQQFLQDLRESRQATMEAWAHQQFPTELANAGALGGVDLLGKVIDSIESRQVQA